VKYSWVDRLLSKVHSEPLQDFKIYHRAIEDCDEAFQTLKKMLITSPVLAQTNIAKPFDIYCDASDTGLGCVLMQEG
jgi:hypothetical protein